jgi:hypothetical protein
VASAAAMEAEARSLGNEVIAKTPVVAAAGRVLRE